MAPKGISLPINMIVILAVAVLVLVVVAAFFVVQTGGSQQTISDQTAWAGGCSTAISQGCSESAFRSPNDPNGGGLYIARYDPNGDDPRDSATKASRCSHATLTTEGCDDDTLLTACERTQGIRGSAACRAKCCGS